MYAYGSGSKKVLDLLILEILRVNTDEEHSLTQQEILRLLDECYGMTCDRRSVKANVLDLKNMGYDIDMQHGYRLLSREFDDAELRALIDSVLFSRAISTSQAQRIIGKLRDLASRHFQAKVSHVRNLPDLQHAINQQAMHALSELNDAVAERRQVSFIYNDIGTDFKLRPRRPEPYIVNPFQIVASNGRFYLIGNFEQHDDVAHCRVDRMTEVRKLASPRKAMRDVPELKGGLNLPRHMAEHVYMFSGPSVAVTMDAPADLMGELVDWFGTDFSITRQEGGRITLRVTCNEMAMRYWALQHGPWVEVLSPASLRERIKQDVEGMAAKYAAQTNEP